MMRPALVWQRPFEVAGLGIAAGAGIVLASTVPVSRNAAVMILAVGLGLLVGKAKEASP